MDYVPIFYWVSIDDLNLIIVIRPQLPPQLRHLLVQILKLGQIEYQARSSTGYHISIYLDSLAVTVAPINFGSNPG